jgi:Mrp family chromosome partitioning ATPase
MAEEKHQEGQQEQEESQDQRLARRMQRIDHKVVILSGKGGVGKSTVSVNLALTLSGKGYRVGLLDTDLHGPNLPKMLGIEHERLLQDSEGIVPLEVTDRLKVVSLAMAGHPQDTPVIWRGPLKYGAIRQFLADVNWGNLDYLIIDSPPGTGDEPLTVCQLLPELDGSVVVTTPQEVSVMDARKTVSFSRKLEIPVLGVVENMSGMVCPHCGGEIDVFGKGGGNEAARQMEVPFLGGIPLDPLLMQAEDEGRSFLDADESGVTAEALRAVSAAIEEGVQAGKETGKEKGSTFK